MLARASIGAGTAAAIGFALLVEAPLQAQSAPGPSDLVLVPGSTGQGSKGVLSINVASGNDNQQLGSLVIANGGSAEASGSAIQTINFLGRNSPGAFAGIGQGVFNGASGVISANVAAGNANQQANVALIATGIAGVTMTDALLAQTRASEPHGQSAPQGSSSNTAAVPSDSFGGAQGLVQLNVTAGDRNSSANIFALTAAGGSS